MTGTEITTLAFSYDGLEPAIRQGVQERTDAIRARFEKQTADVIASGRDLIAIKAQLSHGEWLGWLEAEFPGTARTAQHWMQAAEWAEGKNETVFRLSPTTIYMLAAPSTPPEIVAEVVADLEAGKAVDPTAIKEKIAEAKRPKPATDIAPVPLGKRATKRQEREVRQAVDVGAGVLGHMAGTMADILELLPLSLEDAETLDPILNRASKDIRRLRQRVQDVKLSRPVLTEKGQKRPATIESVETKGAVTEDEKPKIASTDAAEIKSRLKAEQDKARDLKSDRQALERKNRQLRDIETHLRGEIQLLQHRAEEAERLCGSVEPKPMPALKSDAPLDNKFLWAMECAVAEFKKANRGVSHDLVCATINRLYWIIIGTENRQKHPATIESDCIDVTEQQDDTGAGLFE